MTDPALATPWFDFGGEGRALVLAHGGVRTHHDWDACVPALVQHHRVIAVDLRGHGTSAIGEFDLARSVSDIAALIESTSLDRPVLVGHSLGGIVAASYATRYDDIAGVVDVDALGVSVPPVFPEPDGDVHRQKVIERVAAMGTRVGQGEPEASIAREIHDVDIFDLFARSRVPTLFILATERPELRAAAGTGDDSLEATLGHWRRAAHHHLREIASTTPHLRVQSVASSHLVPLRRPDRLVELIEDFTRGLDL